MSFADNCKDADALIIQKQEFSEFMQQLSHDVGNHLQNIRGYAELLVLECESNYLERIMHIAHVTQKMLRRSVEFTDVGPIVHEPTLVNLNDTVREAAEYVVPKEIRFECSNLPSCYAERAKVFLIFTNLLRNALDSNPQGIEVRVQEKQSTYSLLFMNDGRPSDDALREQITTGKISMKHPEGLEILIVKKLVKAHGWSFSLEPASNTCYRIGIPKEDCMRV
jgi:light-regulated signal transduction histidine kinase (bacteriophytochrome)